MTDEQQIIDDQQFVEMPTKDDVDRMIKEAEKDGERKLQLSSVGLFTKEQIIKIFSKTPAQHVHKRPGRGVKEFEYVTGVYIKKLLNFVCGWNWLFEIKDKGVEFEHNQIWVEGKLTIRARVGNEWLEISREQYGSSEIKRYSQDIKNKRGEITYKAGDVMNVGDDLKSAATDALKKCASEFGFASDVYGRNEFKDINENKQGEVDNKKDQQNVRLFEKTKTAIEAIDGGEEKNRAIARAITSKMFSAEQMKELKKLMVNLTKQKLVEKTVTKAKQDAGKEQKK